MKLKVGKQRQKKINETKAQFFKNISNIDKPLARLMKIKREKTQVANVRNEMGNIITNPEGS